MLKKQKQSIQLKSSWNQIAYKNYNMLFSCHGPVNIKSQLVIFQFQILEKNLNVPVCYNLFQFGYETEEL